MSTHLGQREYSHHPTDEYGQNRVELSKNYQQPEDPETLLNQFFLEELLNIPGVKKVYFSEVDEDQPIYKYWILTEPDDPAITKMIFERELKLIQAFDLYLLDPMVIPIDDVDDFTVPDGSRELFHRQ